jgi:phosphate uptake regulator
VEVRKVQITGGSSYVISLPKEWARSMNIKKNDPLAVKIQPDGTLLISPRITSTPEPRIKKLDADAIRDPTFLLRALIGSYIVGHSVIHITSKTKLSPAVRKVANDFTLMTIGQEIVEETDTSIVIKDLLNPTEMPFNNSIKRMYLIVKSMYSDAMIALQKKDLDLSRDIVQRDREVDRLHWLIARQYHLLLREIGLVEKMKVSLREALNFYIISRILERMGDHGERIAGIIPTLIELKVDSKIGEELNTASELAMTILDSSMKALFSANAVDANTVINVLGKLESMADNISNHAFQKKGAAALSIGYINESIRRAGEYSADIAENVINQVIDEDISGK